MEKDIIIFIVLSLLLLIQFFLLYKFSKIIKAIEILAKSDQIISNHLTDIEDSILEVSKDTKKTGQQVFNFSKMFSK